MSQAGRKTIASASATILWRLVGPHRSLEGVVILWDPVYDPKKKDDRVGEAIGMSQAGRKTKASFLVAISTPALQCCSVDNLCSTYRLRNDNKTITKR